MSSTVFEYEQNYDYGGNHRSFDEDISKVKERLEEKGYETDSQVLGSKLARSCEMELDNASIEFLYVNQHAEEIYGYDGDYHRSYRDLSVSEGSEAKLKVKGEINGRELFTQINNIIGELF